RVSTDDCRLQTNCVNQPGYQAPQGIVQTTSVGDPAGGNNQQRRHTEQQEGNVQHRLVIADKAQQAGSHSHELDPDEDFVPDGRKATELEKAPGKFERAKDEEQKRKMKAFVVPVNAVRPQILKAVAIEHQPDDQCAEQKDRILEGIALSHQESNQQREQHHQHDGPVEGTQQQIFLLGEAGEVLEAVQGKAEADRVSLVVVGEQVDFRCRARR